MKLPKPKRVDKQCRLFHTDRLLLSKGESRWATGEFFEDATAAVSGGIRLRTDSRCDICPDLQFDSQTYFESKGVGKSGCVILYSCRVEKDQQFMAQTGHRIVYWFWQHGYSVCKADSYDALRSGLAANVHTLLVMDAGMLAQTVQSRPTRVVNSSAASSHGNRIGWAQYGVGWTIPMSLFKPQMLRLPMPVSAQVYGQHNFSVNVYISQPALRRVVSPAMVQRRIDFNPDEG